MHKIYKTLSEQLQITEREIAKRKALLDFQNKDAQLLKTNKPLIDKYIDGIVKNFYDHQIANPEIALVIGDAETLRRLQSAMHSYIRELFDGKYDAEYVNRRLRIGKIHMRIGVSPKLYISAIYLLQKVLNQAFEMHFYEQMNDPSVRDLLDALNKIILFDVQFVFDTYIASLVAEVETARDELEKYALGLEDEVAKRTAQLQELARKDELTGLLNQRGFYEMLRRELAGAERYKEALCLAYFDLNGFKQLNDTQGHKAGDDLLVLLGGVMISCVREIDMACRYGGDEFCIILPRTEIQDARSVVERLIENFKQKNKTSVSFSVGIISTANIEHCDVDTLVKGADRLMYQAKEMSRKKSGFHICTEEGDTKSGK